VGGAAAYIMLQNTRRASALLYNALHGNPCKKLKIIGVTGTNGKTSVCTLLCEIFEAAGYRCGIIGTVCCRSADGRVFSPQNSNPLANMTTPDPEQLYRILAKMRDDGADTVVMEVTSHALALGKVSPIRFNVGIFTNNVIKETLEKSNMNFSSANSNVIGLRNDIRDKLVFLGLYQSGSFSNATLPSTQTTINSNILTAEQ
jgi:UDP-N-acetylmuramyl tripeptide synthase